MLKCQNFHDLYKQGNPYSKLLLKKKYVYMIFVFAVI